MTTAVPTSSATRAALDSLARSRTLGTGWGPAWEFATFAASRAAPKHERPDALMQLRRLRSTLRAAYQCGPWDDCALPPYVADT